MEEELGECEVRGAYEELRARHKAVCGKLCIEGCYVRAEVAVGGTRVRKQQAGGLRQEAAGGGAAVTQR